MIRFRKSTIRHFSNYLGHKNEEMMKKLLLNWNNLKGDRSLNIHETFVTKRKNEDLQSLVENFTAPALARALRDRENILHDLSELAKDHDVERMIEILKPFNQNRHEQHPLSELVLPRLSETHGLFQTKVLSRMRNRLGRIPREITSRAHKRACVVLPLCSVDNEASVLITQRSKSLRSHSGELCFPGGMLDVNFDSTIVQAGLREMEEEIGLPREKVDVLGILRLDWVEVQALTGVAVTPVVGFFGNFERESFKVNQDEVTNILTFPITSLLDKNNWSLDNHTFCDPKVSNEQIWGLTGYVLFNFMKLIPSCIFENYRDFTRSQSFA